MRINSKVKYVPLKKKLWTNYKNECFSFIRIELKQRIVRLVNNINTTIVIEKKILTKTKQP